MRIRPDFFFARKYGREFCGRKKGGGLTGGYCQPVPNQESSKTDPVAAATVEIRWLNVPRQQPQNYAAAKPTEDGKG